MRDAWEKFFGSTERRDLPVEELIPKWKSNLLELINEMACHLGFGKTLKQLDFDRVYVPVGLSQPSLDNPKIIDEIIALLITQKEEILAEPNTEPTRPSDSDQLV